MRQNETRKTKKRHAKMIINIRRKTKNEKKRKNTKTEEWKMENEKRYTKNEKQKIVQKRDIS